VDPTARFAYVANGGFFFPTIAGYSIGPNGALTLLPGTTTGLQPFSVAVDPTGRFAYVANADSNNVSAYSIASNGALTPVPGSPFAAVGFPSSAVSG
jgi:6-phosphogluconolactonase (cycloisomerase 2 family)